MTGKCWAASIGECGGKEITKEHVFTKSLFKGKVKITSENIVQEHSTPSWLKSNSVEVNIEKVTANILCEAHNKILGEGPDKTAKKLVNALLRINRAMEFRGSRILRSPRTVSISGVSLGQWLCKTHCNMLAATGFQPNENYVFYAFGKPTKNKLFFYFNARKGKTMQIRKGHVRYTQIVNCKDSAENIFQILLSGLTILVSTFPVETIMIGNQPIVDMGWLDRLKKINKPTPLGEYTIIFDWDDEPKYESVFD